VDSGSIEWPQWIRAFTNFSHLSTTFNSSVNFYIYLAIHWRSIFDIPVAEDQQLPTEDNFGHETILLELQNTNVPVITRPVENLSEDASEMNRMLVQGREQHQDAVVLSFKNSEF
jgi:hypothetical protein